MTSNRPTLQRIFTTTHQNDTADSTLPGSFHGCSSIITHVQSQWILVDESPGGASNEINKASQTEEIDAPKDIPANDDDNPIHRTYQFDNCHVYINSFNAHGIKVNNSGNYAPRVTHHGTAHNEDPSSSSKLSRLELREDSSSYALDDSAPLVGIDQKKPTARGKLPATVDAKSMQSNPASTTLPGPESQPFLPIHMGLHPNFLSHILQPFSDDVPNNTANDWIDLPSSTLNSSLHLPDTTTTSKSLEHHLDSALAILIQTSGMLADHGVSPQARNTLKAINSLAASTMETPIYDHPPPFKSVRRVVKWFQIPKSRFSTAVCW